MKNPVKNLIWRVARGEDIQIRQMETDHIINALRMINRRERIGRPWRRKFREILKAELAKRVPDNKDMISFLSSFSLDRRLVSTIETPLPGGKMDVLEIFSNGTRRRQEHDTIC